MNTTTYERFDQVRNFLVILVQCISKNQNIELSLVERSSLKDILPSSVLPSPSLVDEVFASAENDSVAADCKSKKEITIFELSKPFKVVPTACAVGIKIESLARTHGLYAQKYPKYLYTRAHALTHTYMRSNI